jgi:hypothetical protein
LDSTFPPLPRPSFRQVVGDDGPATAMWLMSRMGQDVGPATPF